MHDFRVKLDNVEKHCLCFDNYPYEQIKNIKHNFSYIKTEFKKRWIAAHYKTDTFLAKNDEWLQSTFELPKISNTSAGRPTKTFEEVSDRPKRRKTQELREVSVETLTFATQVKTSFSGEKGRIKSFERNYEEP
nr:unnamed protein product [Callosobruchus analis]